MIKLSVENISKNIECSSDEIGYLLSVQAIKERSRKILDIGIKGDLSLTVDLGLLQALATDLLLFMKERYGSIDNIPFHSRWRHFNVNGIDRLTRFDDASKGLPKKEWQYRSLEMVLVSVLLDAGAGGQWNYHDTETGKKLGRSEGLAIASIDMYMNGFFSNDSNSPLRVDSQALMNLSLDKLAKGFQHHEKENPMAGLQGRLTLLQNLGRLIGHYPEKFKDGRLGAFVSYLAKKYSKPMNASQIFYEVLRSFGNIWPSRINIDGINMGDTWPLSSLGNIKKCECLIPFHKLSQWLTYSLVESLERTGNKVEGVSELTGLAGYRNGGLFLDYGILKLKNPKDIERIHEVDSELVIEWRALTLALLERLHQEILVLTNSTIEQFPMVKMLEGGTWAYGRMLAFKRDSDGRPPLNLKLDGIVF